MPAVDWQPHTERRGGNKASPKSTVREAATAVAAVETVYLLGVCCISLNIDTKNGLFPLQRPSRPGAGFLIIHGPQPISCISSLTEKKAPFLLPSSGTCLSTGCSVDTRAEGPCSRCERDLCPFTTGPRLHAHHHQSRPPVTPDIFCSTGWEHSWPYWTFPQASLSSSVQTP